MIESVHSYPILQEFTTYNMKWTLLSHVKYIIMSEEFNHVWEPKLNDTSFVDSTPNKFLTVPMFGVDFMGRGEVNNRQSFMFEIVYRGLRQQIALSHEWGIKNPSKNLALVHDAIIINIADQDRRQLIKLFDFKMPNRKPIDTGKMMEFEFVESNYSSNEFGEREEGINWVYAIRERGLGV